MQNKMWGADTNPLSKSKTPPEFHPKKSHPLRVSPLQFLMNPQNLHTLSPKKLTIGCPILNNLLCGGIPTNSITELVSESSCGKTQICLQLLLSAQLPLINGGLASSSLYIHTEFPFPNKRLHQLSLSFLNSHPNVFSKGHNPMDHILVKGVQSAEELVGVLDNLDEFLKNRGIGLIVIDSIAALFRSEFENTAKDLGRRTGIFFRISSKLKIQAKRFDLAVFVTNQVVDLIGNDGLSGMRIGNLGSLFTSGRRVCPALGLSWANCVNTRLFLSRNDESVGEERDSVGVVRTRRKLHVVFAPHLPESSCEFVILREGVFGVHPT